MADLLSYLAENTSINLFPVAAASPTIENNSTAELWETSTDDLKPVRECIVRKNSLLSPRLQAWLPQTISLPRLSMLDERVCLSKTTSPYVGSMEYTLMCVFASGTLPERLQPWEPVSSAIRLK